MEWSGIAQDWIKTVAAFVRENSGPRAFVWTDCGVATSQATGLFYANHNNNLTTLQSYHKNTFAV